MAKFKIGDGIQLEAQLPEIKQINHFRDINEEIYSEMNKELQLFNKVIELQVKKQKNINLFLSCTIILTILLHLI